MWRGVLVLTLAVASEASAQPPASSSEAYARGEQQYQAGEFLRAAASFEEAYAIERDPSILFNVAQAYRFGRACAKAAESYRRYLAAVSDAPNAQQVRDYIVEEDLCVRQAGEAKPPRAEPAPGGQPPERGRTRRMGGIALGAAGAVALGAGGYFTWQVSDLERERRACTPCKLVRLEDLDRSGRRAELAQIVAYGVGGLAIAGGVWLYIAGHRAREAPSVTLVPAGPGGVVVGTLRF